MINEETLARVIYYDRERSAFFFTYLSATTVVPRYYYTYIMTECTPIRYKNTCVQV